MVFTRTCSPSSSSVSQCVFYAVVLPSQCKGTVLSIVLPERVETGQCVFSKVVLLSHCKGTVFNAVLCERGWDQG